MAEYTSNLNLEKPTGNENFQRQVINENMEKVDKKFGIGTDEGHTHDGTTGQGKKISYNSLIDKPAAVAPTPHKSSHAAGGADALSCADIGAVTQANFNAHMEDNSKHVPHLGTTANNGNNYSITSMETIIVGQKFSVTFNAAASGTATLNISSIGSAKALVKPGGGDFKPKAGTYTLFYSGSNFQLLGEGGEYGTAGAPQVLTGYTIGTDAGIINGTMANYAGQDMTGTSQEAARITKIGNSGVYADMGYIWLYCQHIGYMDTNTKFSQYIKNLRSENIKAGVRVGNDTVYMTGAYDTEAVNPITAASVLAGKIGWVNGAKITGAILNHTAENVAANSVAPVSGRLYMGLTTAYYKDCNVYYDDADFIAENIKKGVNLFGIVGTFVAGGFTPGDNVLFNLGTGYTVNNGYSSWKMTIGYSGMYRIKVQAKRNWSVDSVMRIAVDGALVGPVWNLRANTQDFVADLSVSAGAQLRMYVAPGEDQGAYIQNLHVCIAEPLPVKYTSS